MIQPETIQEYKILLAGIEKLGNGKIETIRYLLRTDLFFLLWYGFNRADVLHPWILARCKEVQNAPDGYLDLWAREHYKSTIITYAKTIQDILASHGDNPLPKWGGFEPTFGIFSHTRPNAKGFLRQIKREFESNELLRNIFPDIIWQNCHKEAPKWSEDDGLILIRKNNPKESTVEAWGLVDSQPTGKHFYVLIYDDVVTEKSITTPEMMLKTLTSWELSTNLGTEGGKERYIGTRYHFNDAYKTIMSRGITPREHPALENGQLDGAPVFRSKEFLAERLLKQGPYTFSCQMLLNPIADAKQSFNKDWLKFHKGSDGESMNRYILVDPASEKKKTSDYTAMVVVGLGADRNYYLLDAVRDRLNLKERADLIFRLHRKWRPLRVGYEKYGMQADIEYIKERQHQENYHFNIVELGGNVAKIDRIKRLIPIFSEGRFYLPDSIFKNNYEGKVQDLIDIFINEEYLAFPVPVHDDMFDCIARILEPDLLTNFPMIEDDDRRDYGTGRQRSYSTWAA
jgi:phage terminase large subunit-like protein